MLSVEHAESLLTHCRRQGWQFEPLGETDLQRSYLVRRDKQSQTVTFSPVWVYLQSPLVPPGQGPSDRWLHDLLFVTDDIHLAKCSLDSQGQAMLQVELPLRQLDCSQFEGALRAMTGYRLMYGVKAGGGCHSIAGADVTFIIGHRCPV